MSRWRVTVEAVDPIHDDAHITGTFAIDAERGQDAVTTAIARVQDKGLTVTDYHAEKVPTPAISRPHIDELAADTDRKATP